MKFSEIHIGLLPKGDKRAYLLLYEDFFSALCNFVISFGLSSEEAKDIVQETFCKLNGNQSIPKGMNSFRAYLYASVRNRSLNYLRDEKRRRAHESVYTSLLDDMLIFDKIAENELYRQMRMFLMEMPPQCRNIFKRVLNGDTSEKIAVDLNISVETVKTQRKKAKRIIKDKYALIYKTICIFL